MGSSGTEDWIIEAIKTFKLNKEDNWNAVVLASPSICSLEKAQEVAGGDPRLLVTDKFIPAPAANALADVVVIHGGQGTVQTSIAAGKPMVGVALQIEQQTNLDNVMNAGAGIRIQRQNWKAKNIRSAVLTMLKNPSYAAKARILGETIRNMDGAKTAAEAMWKFVLEGKNEKSIAMVSVA
jgi:UDP:flavonoid glycosyltransferase YjiC (YdhE family)